MEHDKYVVSCNGSEEVDGEVVKEMGNYNALMGKKIIIFILTHVSRNKIS